MDKYAYLIGNFLILIPLAIAAFLRKDLRLKILISGTIGGILGLISEFWYHADYWNPNTIIGHSRISIEDFLFGFLIASIGASIFDVVMKKKLVKSFNNEFLYTAIFSVSGIASLILFSNILKINSIFVSSLTFLIISAIIIAKRRDLLKPSLVSGILLTALMIPIYLILFTVMFPDFWQKNWQLANTEFGATLLGIPLTELLWYFSWGCLSGIGYDFMFGLKKDSVIEN